MTGAAARPVSPPAHLVVALGDALSNGWGSAGAPYPDATASWSTGSQPGVGSHLDRLARQQPGLRWAGLTLAAAGTQAGDVVRQAGRIPRGAVEVTVTAGLANLCLGSVTRAGQLAPAEVVGRQVGLALQRIAARAPGARIVLASVPDPTALWTRFHDDPAVRAGWSRPGTCPLVLGAHATAATRDAVHVTAIAYNLALRDACAAVPACRWDGGAVARIAWRRVDLSPYDGYSLSPRGEARVALATWRALGGRL